MYRMFLKGFQGCNFCNKYLRGKYLIFNLLIAWLFLSIAMWHDLSQVLEAFDHWSVGKKVGIVLFLWGFPFWVIFNMIYNHFVSKKVDRYIFMFLSGIPLMGVTINIVVWLGQIMSEHGAPFGGFDLLMSIYLISALFFLTYIAINGRPKASD